MNPFAKDTESGTTRIKQGLDKLFNTTEAERISLYEASLIRYFYPEFNKEFRDSFPSTNLKILQDCYEKDFAAVIAEICIDELPFYLWSASAKRSLHHIARHDLHKSRDRKMFFGR
jgi:tRNA nucleotidyltransferase/poly(A) polymerase